MARKPPPPAHNILAALGQTDAATFADPDPPPPITPGVPAHLVERMRLVRAEKLARDFEALKLFEPLAEQDRFLRSHAKTRVYRGGNRAGKTTIGAVECALAVTGKQGLHGYYPRENVRIMVVAWDMRDTGLVIYRSLFEGGAFQVIWDPDLKKTRAFRPWQEYDQAYREKARDAPPLVPPRFVPKGYISWHVKAEGQPSTVRTITGAEILFFSSLGDPRKGIKQHAAWIDEEMQGARWLPEIRARLIDHDGLLFWTATPQNGTPELLDIIEWAEREQEKLRENPSHRVMCEDFLLSQVDNPHLSESGREHFIAGLTLSDDDDLDVRVGGEVASYGNLVFPEFSERGAHSVEPFSVPDHWTRYLIVDPARACASILFAVPPPEDPVHGGHVYGVDDIFISQSDAVQYADRARAWFEAGVVERMWFDMQYGRQTHSSGRQEVSFYEEEFKKRGMLCRQTGHKFETAPSGREEGIEAVRSWLRRLPDGLPKFRIFYEKRRRFENFVRQMKRFQYALDPRDRRPTSKPVFKRCDLIDVLRYAAMLDLRWVPPAHGHGMVLDDYAAKLAEKMRREGVVQRGGMAGSITLGPQGVWGS
jgi:hypothetical protein